MFTAELEGEAELERVWGRIVNEVRVGFVRGVGGGARDGAAEARAKHTFRNRTGALERGIHHVVVGWVNGTTYVAKIVSKEHYSSYVEEGTKPHTIFGNPFLSFEWKGALVHLRYVNHPGTRPQPFMHHAYYKAERVLIREIEVAIDKASMILARFSLTTSSG